MEYLDENPDLEINLKNIEEKPQSNKNSNQKLPVQDNKFDFKKSPVEITPLNPNLVNNNDINIQNNKLQRNNKISAKSKESVSSKNQNKSTDSQRDEKKQKINNIFGELKLKYNYQLSPYTDLKSFGELTPGLGNIIMLK